MGRGREEGEEEADVDAEGEGEEEAGVVGDGVPSDDGGAGGDVAHAEARQRRNAIYSIFPHYPNASLEEKLPFPQYIPHSPLQSIRQGHVNIVLWSE